MHGPRITYNNDLIDNYKFLSKQKRDRRIIALVYFELWGHIAFFKDSP